MKGFILAAGHGTRLQPYTNHVPKCLLPIKGVPMLGIWLRLCRRYGITEVLVNTHAHSVAVMEFARNWNDGVRIHVVDEPKLFGSAGTLRANRSWVAGEERFWVFYADVLTSANLDAMDKAHSADLLATLGVYSVPDPQRCGIAVVNAEGVVVEFEEKPTRPQGNLAFSGVMIGTPAMLDAIPDKEGADIGFDVLPKLAGRMAAYRIPEFLIDIGTLENYEFAQRAWPGLSIAEQEQVLLP